MTGVSKVSASFEEMSPPMRHLDLNRVQSEMPTFK